MKKIIRLFLLLGMCLLSSTSKISSQTYWQNQTSPKYEIRAVWLTTIGGIDWPHSYSADEQRKELIQTLDKLKHAGINTVFLQTRVRATTIYPSVYEPWDACMSGTPGKAPKYNPLQFAIDECHKRGMQLHAWVVTIPIGKWTKYGCQQLRKKHPKMVIKIGEDGYLNPESQETSAYLSAICREIVENYDVDGIHLDYIRYPETWKLRVSREQGRTNITRIARDIYIKVKAVKPWVMVSCSPIGKHDDLLRYRSNGWNARTRVCQDAQQWLKDGIMDALFPMMYFRDNNFFPFAIDWQEHSYGRFVVPGLGIYFLDPREGKWTLDDIERQMSISRQLGMGHCYFRSKFLIDNIQGIYDFGCEFDNTPSLIPPMSWSSGVQPEAPEEFRIEDDTTLKWFAKKDYVYNVYASKEYPVDITNAKNLMATRLRTDEFVIDKNAALNYAITAQDRFGQESPASQLEKLLNSNSVSMDLSQRFYMANERMELPFKPSTLDADYILIQTLQGTTIALYPYKGHDIDISKLSNGIYQWRSLGKKGRHHRMGFFSVKHQQNTK